MGLAPAAFPPLFATPGSGGRFGVVVVAFGGSKRLAGRPALAYSGSTFGRFAWMSLMRVGPEGCVLKNCGGAPFEASAIFCHSVTPARGL